jgi:DNA-directed RNA polymerase sigma subunit (sigma70/sigma32)
MRTRSVGSWKPLRVRLFDKEEEARLANAAKQRDTKRLVQAQLRLVVSIGVPVRR